MKYSKTFKAIMGIVATLLLVAIILSLTPLTPAGAIRFCIAVHGDPLAALRVTIHQGEFFECSRWSDAYGWQFFVDGLNIHGNNICFFYLNRNSWGLWSVTSAGTGP